MIESEIRAIKWTFCNLKSKVFGRFGKMLCEIRACCLKKCLKIYKLAGTFILHSRVLKLTLWRLFPTNYFPLWHGPNKLPCKRNCHKTEEIYLHAYNQKNKLKISTCISYSLRPKLWTKSCFMI